ncbi:DEAD/DEAH box helicase [Pelosinus sp. UFO1]|uniref:DEAD/DEAH box helicase n=1 Tax=Pelosinus sp. UFO1 TaxID=484770 RepID=UPI0004D14BD7|nr:DEAD/DEAH box helicase [Pelosinus sp. UFO1]AIF53380.1 DEAD/DEAH box helicase domain protein [Pelosinus sp. UFO1]
MDGQNVEKYTFSKEIAKALEELGYETLTKVQEKVIPLALAQKDIVVRSQTGSGKTAAFAIPVCEKIIIEQKNPQVLVLTPTRELAVQLKQEISNIGRFKRIRCAVVFGRQPMEVQKRELRQRVHIVVGTPGRTLDHIERKNMNLAEVQYLIIDEADKMLDMGFIEQVEAILTVLPISRVTMLFSATMPDKIQEICKKYMKNPIKIEVDAENPSVKNIEQAYYEVAEDEKFDLLTSLIYIERPDSGILFCNTRDKVETLFAKMKQKGYSCGSLHGGMEQRDRLHSIQDFKRGEYQFLIATDVAARGIHIDDIALVVNYDMPLDNESYVHRIGRTGRAGNLGRAISFVTKNEYRTLHEIEEYVDYKIPEQEIPNREDVAAGKLMFNQHAEIGPTLKIDKSAALNRQITRLRINAGKKTKMRPGDILGAITTIPGIGGGDIGIIDVQDTCSYVEILGDKGDLVMDGLQETKIKGKIHKIKEVGFSSI